MKTRYALLAMVLTTAGCSLDIALDGESLTVRVEEPLGLARQTLARAWPQATTPQPASQPSVQPAAQAAFEEPEEPAAKEWRGGSRGSRPTHADPCAQANSGDGLYCGRSLGGSAGPGLYRCRGRRTVSVTACANGCSVQPPGTPDACVGQRETPASPTPSAGTRPSTRARQGGAPAFYLPLACGQRVAVLQGHHGAFSHNAMNTWAYDFTVPRGTPVYAMEGGTVTHVRSAERPGTACWNGGDRSCTHHTNYVSILHSDGTRTLYLHLDAPEVSRGDVVVRGQRIGRSGNTGFSTRPHLHVQRQPNCGRWFCQSQPLSFAEAGMPTTGGTVTSRNCR